MRAQILDEFLELHTSAQEKSVIQFSSHSNVDYWETGKKKKVMILKAAQLEKKNEG